MGRDVTDGYVHGREGRMSRLVDILILLLAGIGLQLLETGEWLPVLATLAGIILASMSLYLSDERKLAVLTAAGFLSLLALP